MFFLLFFGLFQLDYELTHFEMPIYPFDSQCDDAQHFNILVVCNFK